MEMTVASEEFKARVAELVGRITYKAEGHWLTAVHEDKANPGGRIYIQVMHYRPDVNDPESWAWGKGGKIYLSEHMTDSEIVRKIFQGYMAYEEHEAREWFKYNDRAVFGPHIDVNALWLVAEHLDVRSEESEEEETFEDTPTFQEN